MSNFEEAFKYTIGNEGGFTNNPNDKGGSTKYGITQSELAIFRKKPVSIEEVNALLISEAKEIYEHNYWIPSGCNLIDDQAIATAIFDFGVNMGIISVVKIAQEALSVTIDGHFGPETTNVINSIGRNHFLAKFIPLIQDRYVDIVLKNHDQVVFLKGWLKRSQKLLTLMS